MFKVRWISPLCLIILVFCLSLPAAPPVDRPRVDGHGKILFAGKTFTTWGEYFKSDEFRLSGRRCGTGLRPYHPGPAKRTLAAEDCSLQQTAILPEYWPVEVLTIPVVFHVIYHPGGEGNIPDQRIYDQLTALNEDFRAMPETPGANGSDTRIQFELAGITRTADESWFNDEDETAYKSALAWNPAEYLNIYLNTAGGYLGYSYYPQDQAPPELDGIVLLYEVCGGRNLEGMEPYDQGRTLTHETGHYLGLLHTFENGCGEGYTAGDLIADTNPEQEEHYGCEPTNSCGFEDPIHNYMNYTDDLCMEEFTPEQANRAVCSLQSYRPATWYYDNGENEPELFIAESRLTIYRTHQGTYFCRGVFRIGNSAGKYPSGVQVSMRWTGQTEAAEVKTSNPRGYVVFYSGEVPAIGEFILSITNLYHPDHRYPLRQQEYRSGGGLNPAFTQLQ